MTQPPLPLRRILMDSLRLYFAPLTGAYRGIKAEFARLDRDIEQRRQAEREAGQRSAARAPT